MTEAGINCGLVAPIGKVTASVSCLGGGAVVGGGQ